MTSVSNSGNEPLDYFKILGLSQKDLEGDNSLSAVRRAYRKKASEFHPDKNPTANTEEQMKDINEAYGVFSDPRKLLAYLKEIHELGLDYGVEENITGETGASEYADILEGKTFRLPSVGSMGKFGLAVKDLLAALEQFYSGASLEEINKQVWEHSRSWELDVYENFPGIPKIVIDPYSFLIDVRGDVEMRHRNNGFDGKTEAPVFIQNGEYIDIRLFSDSERRHYATNISFGTIPQQEWQDIIEATDLLARHNAGWEITEAYQGFVRNVFVRAYREYGDRAAFDEITVPRMGEPEGSVPMLELTPTRA